MQIEWLTLNDESTIVLFYRRCSSAWQRSLSWWKNKARHLSVNGKLYQILWWVTNHLGPRGKVFCYPKGCGFGHFNTVILYFSFLQWVVLMEWNMIMHWKIAWYVPYDTLVSRNLVQTALSARHKPAPKQMAQKRAPVSKYMYRCS